MVDNLKYLNSFMYLEQVDATKECNDNILRMLKEKWIGREPKRLKFKTYVNCGIQGR